MILAAGLGTRLRPLTDVLPKPLVPLGDRSLLVHLCDMLLSSGVDRIVVNTHFKAEAIQSAIQAYPHHVIQISHEPNILGTAGGIQHASRFFFQEDLIVYNADIVSNVNFEDLYRFHQDAHAYATLVTTPFVRNGNIGCNTSGPVVRLRDAALAQENMCMNYMGIAILSHACWRAFPEKGCLIGDGLIPALHRGERIQAHSVQSEWTDIGELKAYVQANFQWLGSNHTSYVSALARVSPHVSVENSIVGEGALIEGEGSLVRCIVWPHAHVIAPLQNAVVLTNGQIVLF